MYLTLAINLDEKMYCLLYTYIFTLSILLDCIEYYETHIGIKNEIKKSIFEPVPTNKPQINQNKSLSNQILYAHFF